MLLFFVLAMKLVYVKNTMCTSPHDEDVMLYFLNRGGLVI